MRASCRFVAIATTSFAIVAGADDVSKCIAPLGCVRSSEDDRPTVDALLSRLLAKYGQTDKKYDALADKIDAEVKKALQSTVWLNEKEAKASRSFTEHPFCALIEHLSQTAKSDAHSTQGTKKPIPSPLLAKYPWSGRLELDLGLDIGSERPVPKNEKGFVALGDAPDPFPGFPELLTNEYLYGLQEVVSWHAGVKVNKDRKLAYQGRDPKNPPAPDATLPGWEAIRVFLEGSTPEVPLCAMPGLTHAIHSRLVERRKTPSGDFSRMDEVMAYLDSKWNGFTFQVPFSKDRLAIVVPVHALMTDRSGFIYRFHLSAGLAASSDLPFLSLQSFEQYAKVFLGKRLDLSDFTNNSPSWQATVGAIEADEAYLARYKGLIDLVVRAVLAPQLRYPDYLAFADFPKGRTPSARKADPTFDITRRHALLVWAYAGRDPAKVADFLFENVLDQEANRFPKNVNLAMSFTTVVRAKEKEMLGAIAARINDERKASAAKNGGCAWPSDFEREFSPFANYLDPAGAPASDYLLNSFQSLNERVTKIIEDTAYSVVQAELGK